MYNCAYIYILLLSFIYITYTYYTYQQGFPYWGIGLIPPLVIFAHSPCTWNNFFPHQRLIPSPRNKNFHVINQ